MRDSAVRPRFALAPALAALACLLAGALILRGAATEARRGPAPAPLYVHTDRAEMDEIGGASSGTIHLPPRRAREYALGVPQAAQPEAPARWKAWLSQSVRFMADAS